MSYTPPPAPPFRPNQPLRPVGNPVPLPPSPPPPPPTPSYGTPPSAAYTPAVPTTSLHPTPVPPYMVDQVDEDEQKRRKLFAFGGGGLGLIVLLVLFFTVAQGHNAVAAPTTFVPYSSPDNSFACLMPSDWRREETANAGVECGVTAKHDNARVVIHSDLQGSLMGDMMNLPAAQFSGSDNAPIVKSLPAVEKLHIAARQEMEKIYTDYDEKPMETVQCALGEARRTEWAGEKELTWGKTKLHGYRITILNGDRRTTVHFRCEENDWKTLKPTFDKVLGSLKAGTPGL